MKASLFVRALTCEEEYRLKRCLRGKDLFALRRAHLILGSARGVRVPLLSQQTGYTVQMVGYVIHTFNEQGVACLVRQSNRPKTAAPLLREEACQQLGQFLHQSPRLWGKKSSVWSLALLAEVAFEEGLTPHLASDETLRRALLRLKVNWKRAKHWIMDHQSRSSVCAQKKWRERLRRLAHSHPHWVLSYQDEVWFSRVAQPQLHAWTSDKPLPLQLLSAPLLSAPLLSAPLLSAPLLSAPLLSAPRHDPDAKALAC
jgi:transposase